jgi:sensor histidine kinase YesM
MDGYAFRYLWPSLPVINRYEDVLGALVGVAAILFATNFLNTKKNAPLIHKIFYGILFIYIVIIAIIFSNNFLLGTVAVEITSLGLVLLIFVAAFSLMRKGYRPAKFFLIAWSLLLFSAIVFILKDYNLLPYNNVTVNALQIGSAFEALLLSIALADRINSYREERTRAQGELIKSLQERTNMQQQMLQLEAKALRSQMDPHFIFNCMNSIKSLIQQKEEDKAVNYLTTFSKLLRTILQNADKREITLHDEIETCKLYTQLEGLRFGNKLSYSFVIDEDIDLKSIQVPALILQPFIENAIWHGIIPKETGGTINVRVKKADDYIHCIIDDDGIGREVSLQSKLKQPLNGHQSKGVKLTQSRLDLDNALNNRNATVETVDKKDSAGQALGTTIILTFKEY